MSTNGETEVVFVVGPPGAGKTSVTEAYEQAHPNTAQFGTGELIWGIAAGRQDSKYAAILRDAANKHVSLPGEVFSMVVHEEITRLSENAETVMITSFPHDYADWDVFNQTISSGSIRPIGSVVLTADLDIAVSRMQERDVKKGVDVELVTSAEERRLYEERYLGLMARLAIRLDCYKQSGLPVIPISALQPRDIVLSEFSHAIDTFKDRRHDS